MLPTHVDLIGVRSLSDAPAEVRLRAKSGAADIVVLPSSGNSAAGHASASRRLRIKTTPRFTAAADANLEPILEITLRLGLRLLSSVKLLFCLTTKNCLIYHFFLVFYFRLLQLHLFWFFWRR